MIHILYVADKDEWMREIQQRMIELIFIRII